MKKTITEEMLIPKYIIRFSCIGGDCEDTCCAAWQVDLDKDSFLHYQSCFDPVLRPLLLRYAKRNPKPETPEKYGYMEHIDDSCRHCGLLSEAKLCRIHERLGESALSNLCATYPRNTYHFGGLYQMTLALSCPEAARLALLEEDAFDFVAMEHTVRTGSVSVINPKPGIPLTVMDDVRTSIIQILRTQELELSIRMKVVGIFCERLTALIQAKQYGSIPGLIQEIDAAIATESWVSSLAGMKERPEFQAPDAVLFFNARGTVFQTSRQRSIMDMVTKTLGVGEDGTFEPSVLLQSYEVGLARLVPALDNVPWLLEHFLLNEVLTEIFPWKGKSPQEHYDTLFIRLAILRVMLAGRAAAQEAPLTPLELAETVQVFSRLPPRPIFRDPDKG